MIPADPAALIADLTAALPPGALLTDEAARAARRHDYWVISHVRTLAGQAGPPPLCVARPTATGEVQAVMRIAAAAGAPVIPFGLGSGVVGGVIARPDAILLDLGGMTRTRFIDPVNLLAGFDAGRNGLEAEAAVAEHGLTIGHWPQSVAVSTVGGWVATRASGQFSTAYGAIEDLVEVIEAVLPNGNLVTLGRGPRASAGPDLRHLMLGSEGTLGVITGVTFALRRAAERRAVSVHRAADMPAGFEFQRRLVQAGWRPPVMRQYDLRESRRMDPDGEGCLVLMVHEGPAGLVAAQLEAVAALAEACGLPAAPDAIAMHWLENRNHVTPWDQILSRGVIADTVEISGSWTAVGAIYDDAVAALKEMDGVRAASAHSSHAYRTGLNLYFTFALQTGGPAEMEGAYSEAWRRIMLATDRHGGSLSHHHGVGRVRRAYLERELGAGGVALLRRLKTALDPAGLMNPGVLLPDA